MWDSFPAFIACVDEPLLWKVSDNIVICWPGRLLWTSPTERCALDGQSFAEIYYWSCTSVQPLISVESYTDFYRTVHVSQASYPRLNFTYD